VVIEVVRSRYRIGNVPDYHLMEMHIYMMIYFEEAKQT
jgi:hypothetical protein